jgi:hypothetical protein
MTKEMLSAIRCKRLKISTFRVSDPGICTVNPGKLYIIVGVLPQAKCVNVQIAKTFPDYDAKFVG